MGGLWRLALLKESGVLDGLNDELRRVTHSGYYDLVLERSRRISYHPLRSRPSLGLKSFALVIQPLPLSALERTSDSGHILRLSNFHVSGRI